MQPMSDPKISPNKLVSFQDRLYVIGNASFICLVVSIVWTALFVGRAQLSLSTLVLISAPLVATGTTVIVGSLMKDLVPKPIISSPLNFTIPVIWCLCCYLAVVLLSTQETGLTRIPDPLLPVLTWSKFSNLLPVMVGQTIALSLVIMLSKDNS